MAPKFLLPLTSSGDSSDTISWWRGACAGDTDEPSPDDVDCTDAWRCSRLIWLT